jgi:hypothetical protein
MPLCGREYGYHCDCYDCRCRATRAKIRARGDARDRAKVRVKSLMAVNHQQAKSIDILNGQLRELTQSLGG